MQWKRIEQGSHPGGPFIVIMFISDYYHKKIIIYKKYPLDQSMAHVKPFHSRPVEMRNCKCDKDQYSGNANEEKVTTFIR